MNNTRLIFLYIYLFALTQLGCNTSANQTIQNQIDEYVLLEKQGNLQLLDSCKYQLQQYIAQSTGENKFTLHDVGYTIFVADLASQNINLHLFSPNTGNNFSTLKTVKNYLDSLGTPPLMLTNAGMFTSQQIPEGLYIENGKEYFTLDTLKPDTLLNFYLQPNGVFYIDTLGQAYITTTDEYIATATKTKIKTATQSGPMLIINGKLHPAFKEQSTSKFIRSGVGILGNKKVIFACTSSGSNFYHFANTFKDIFGCNNALFLDGAISLMYINKYGALNKEGNFGPIISVTAK